jgi:hypothetical protein
MLTRNAASFVLLTIVLVVHAMIAMIAMIATAMLYERRCVWKIVELFESI